MENFQSTCSRQGKTGERLAHKALRRAGFTDFLPHYVIVGGSVDIVATARSGRAVAFEVKWSRRATETHPPGLQRTDTINKAIAEAWKVRETTDMPFVVLTSHKPTHGAALDSANLALGEGLIRAIFLTRDIRGLRDLYESA